MLKAIILIIFYSHLSTGCLARVLQRVAVCCSVLQCVAGCGSVCCSVIILIMFHYQLSVIIVADVH